MCGARVRKGEDGSTVAVFRCVVSSVGLLGGEGRREPYRSDKSDHSSHLQVPELARRQSHRQPGRVPPEEIRAPGRGHLVERHGDQVHARARRHPADGARPVQGARRQRSPRFRQDHWRESGGKYDVSRRREGAVVQDMHRGSISRLQIIPLIVDHWLRMDEDRRAGRNGWVSAVEPHTPSVLCS